MPIVAEGLSARSYGIIWSSLGNACGLFCLSAVAMMGFRALLASSECLFNVVRITGAGYLFYLGARQLLKKSPALAAAAQGLADEARPSRCCRSS